MKRSIVVLGVILSLLIPGASIAQSDRIAEVKVLLKSLDSTNAGTRINAAKVINRSGLTSQELYQKVASLLKANYASNSGSKHIDEMSWLCKALAASGDLQYRPLLDEVAENASSMKLGRYAKQSSSAIEGYAKRNQSLNSTEANDESLSAEENSLVNMLKSDDVKTMRNAAKAIVRGTFLDDKIFDVVEIALLGMTEKVDRESKRSYIDTMSWLCKALATSGNSKYAPTVSKVMAATNNDMLIMHSSQALHSLR